MNGNAFGLEKEVA